MSRTSFLYRVERDNGHHLRVSVFAGPDEQHRACCGVLTFRSREFEDWCERVVGPGHTLEPKREAG